MNKGYNRYPVVQVDLSKLKNNLAVLKEHCQKFNIDVTAVVKGFNGLPEVVKIFENEVPYIASSRLEQLKEIKNRGIKTPLMHIRLAMPSEIKDLVDIANLSLQSEFEIIKKINLEAEKQNKIHKVILMADLGDLREGFWNKNIMLEVAENIENNFSNVYLAGIGTNLGCYGSIKASPEKLSELEELSKKVEEKIGRKLDIVSGGASSSLENIKYNTMPKGINHLRIGEALLFGTKTWGYNIENLYDDVFTLKSEIIEIKDKPSFPVGERTVDAFGKAKKYVDIGVRKRALLAIGRVDYGDPFDLKPIEHDIKIVGASSDHTIIDIEDSVKDYKLGQIVNLKLSYGNLVYLTNTAGVDIEIIK